MPTCYCLVPDESGLQLLVESGPDGWTLPAVEHADDWFAHEAVSVARRLGERLGLRLVALREIDEAGMRLCELENLATDGAPADGFRWVDRAAASDLHLAPAELRALLLTWFDDFGRGQPPAARAPWETRGWYTAAVAWIEEQLARLGYTATGPIEQVKTAWSCSSILRVPTTAGDLYFKATYARPPAEVSVIEELARRRPRQVPTVIAGDAGRRWMLMEDFGPRELSRMPFARWPRALLLFGRLQRECSEDLSPWMAIGCPGRRMDKLVDHLDALLADPLLAQSDPPFRLGEEDLSRLLAHRDIWVHGLCALASSPIPPAIVQQDFRDGNVAIRGRDYVFYDWSDTVLSHPFFSACRFLEYVGTQGSGARRRSSRRLPTAVRHVRLRAAYLDAWADYGAREQLEAVFRQVQRLNPLYQAIRWHHELPYCEPGSPWWRGMLSSTTESLRAALVSMEKLKLLLPTADSHVIRHNRHDRCRTGAETSDGRSPADPARRVWALGIVVPIVAVGPATKFGLLLTARIPGATGDWRSR
jgi:hypothetical protein